MPPSRPLRDVFAELAGAARGPDNEARSPENVLAEAGHSQLPDGLVAEAVVSYADTAPIEVAEHLAPYVMAHSPVPTDVVESGDQPGWLEMLSAAPDLAGIDALPPDDHGVPGAPGEVTHVAFGSGAGHDPVDLDFGHGATYGDDWAGHEHGTHTGRLDAAADGSSAGTHDHTFHDAVTSYDDPHGGRLDEGHPHDLRYHDAQSHDAQAHDAQSGDGHIHDGHIHDGRAADGHGHADPTPMDDHDPLDGL